MRYLRSLWCRLEEYLVAFLLGAMTLVTFTYVIANNLFTVFYDAADWLPFAEVPLLAIGDAILGIAQDMTWSIALTKAMFAWLIFIGIAYAVRLGAHIGVDLLVRWLPPHWRRVAASVACLLCIGYASLLMASSFSWVSALMNAGIGAEDLDNYGVEQWHITLVVPLGFALMILRLLEVLINILRGRLQGIDQAHEASEALKLSQQADTEDKDRS